MTDEELRRLAEEWLGRVFRREGYDYAQTTAAVLFFAEELEPMLRRVADQAAREERLATCGHFKHPIREDICFECGDGWPCITVRRIKGGE